MDVEKRIIEFCDNCNCQDEIARTIKDQYISGNITLQKANELSSCFGIAPPLHYWK